MSSWEVVSRMLFWWVMAFIVGVTVIFLLAHNAAGIECVETGGEWDTLFGCTKGARP